MDVVSFWCHGNHAKGAMQLPTGSRCSVYSGRHGIHANAMSGAYGPWSCSQCRHFLRV